MQECKQEERKQAILPGLSKWVAKGNKESINKCKNGSITKTGNIVSSKEEN